MFCTFDFCSQPITAGLGPGAVHHPQHGTSGAAPNPQHGTTGAVHHPQHHGTTTTILTLGGGTLPLQVSPVTQYCIYSN